MAVKDKKKAKVAMGSTSATPHIKQEKEEEKESTVIADSSGLLQTLQGHVEEVRALIQCGICVRPLYEPYTLACGHTFCYGCLTSWFSSGRSNKTCPDCRAQVKIQPAPAYLVRAIVQMFTSNAELLEKGETTSEHSKNQREEAEKLEADKTSDHPNTGGLFQGCFKPKPHHLGPIFDADDGVTRCPNCAWELEEDECVNCGYHAEDGTIGDSEDFSDMTDEDDEDDDNEDDDDEEMDDDMTDYDGAWVDDYPNPLPFHVAQQLYDEAHDIIDHHFHHPPPYPLHHHRFMPPIWIGNEGFDPMGHMDASSMTHTSDNGSEEEDDDNLEESSNSSEDEDDEEMESFIDDGSIIYENSQDSEGGYNTDHSTVVGDRSDEIDPGTDPESSSSEDSDGPPFPEYSIRSGNYIEDEEEEDEDEPIRPAPIRRSGQNAFYRSNPISRGSSRAGLNPTSGLQNRSSNGAPTRRIGMSRSHTHGAPLFQAHQSHPIAGTSINRGDFRNPRNISMPGSPGAGTSATNAITVDDDSEDEMPVPATRRTRNNRR